MPSPLPELRNGLARNEITGRLPEMANLPIKQLDGRLRSGEIFVAEVDGDSAPVLAHVDRRGPKTSSRGCRSPRPGAELTEHIPQLTICNGIHSCSVYGAVRSLADTVSRKSNEKCISATSRDAGRSRY
jgi:hypothetical protein